MSSATRQEFVLLSDVLGVSMLVENINQRKSPGATEATVVGPFHMVEPACGELGESIDLVRDGEPCLITFQVRAVDGTPLPWATVDVPPGAPSGPANRTRRPRR